MHRLGLRLQLLRLLLKCGVSLTKLQLLLT